MSYDMFGMPTGQPEQPPQARPGAPSAQGQQGQQGQQSGQGQQGGQGPQGQQGGQQDAAPPEQPGQQTNAYGPSTAPVYMVNTPNAEKYLLEADAMRRRQLRTALLHGSGRTWREHSKVWPAVTVGVVAAAVIVAGIAVKNAVNQQSKDDKKQQQELKKQEKGGATPKSPQTPRASKGPSSVPTSPLPKSPSSTR